MYDNELKKMSRGELLEMFLEQAKEVERFEALAAELQTKAEEQRTRAELLQTRVDELQAQTQSLQAELEKARTETGKKVVYADKPGTMAEAVMTLNGVFEAADAAAKQYVDTIQVISENQEMICRRKLFIAKKKADEIVAKAEQEAELKRKEADEYWDKLAVRLEKFYEECSDMRAMLSRTKE